MTDTPLTVVHCDSLEGLEAAVRGGAKRLIFGGESYTHASFTYEIWKKAVAIGNKSTVPVWAGTPRVMKQADTERIRRELQSAIRAGVDGIYANTPGIFSLVHEEEPNCFIIGDQYLNIFNSQAAFIYEEVGCSAITASCEMTWKQIERLASLQKLPVEVVVSGKAEPAYLSIASGGVMCEADHTTDARRIAPFVLNQFDALIRGDWSVLDAAPVERVVQELVEDWGEYYLERPIRSLRLIDS